MRDAIALVELLDDKNVRAFLHMIRVGEGTADPEGYRRHFGGSHFDSFADHPRKVITAGLGKNQYSSSAAGAYQFLTKTWDGLKRYGFADFSPKNQDIAALALIDGRGALDDVVAGRFEQAVRKCAKEWASLPFSPYGQPTKTLAQALRTYQDAGGLLAPQEPQMSLLLPLAGALIDIFSPLAKEKITKEMAKHTSQPEVAQQIAQGVIETAKTLTGKEDLVEAVAAAKADPAIVQQIEAKALIDVDKLAGVLERFNAMEQGNISAARKHNADEPFFLDTPWLKLKFIHALSLVFVGFSGWFVTQNWAALTPELKGAVITLMVIAGWNGVRDYWMGSSSGSERKTEMLTKREG